MAGASQAAIKGVRQIVGNSSLFGEVKITAKPRIRCSHRNRAKGIAVAGEIVASGEGVGKDAFGFLRDAVEAEMSSSRRALREGVSSGMSTLLAEVDAERESLRCESCGGSMVRRSR